MCPSQGDTMHNKCIQQDKFRPTATSTTSLQQIQVMEFGPYRRSAATRSVRVNGPLLHDTFGRGCGLRNHVSLRIPSVRVYARYFSTYVCTVRLRSVYASSHVFPFRPRRTLNFYVASLSLTIKIASDVNT